VTTATLSIRQKTTPCRLHCHKVNINADLYSLSDVVSKLPNASILGANQSKAEADGFSYWMAEPIKMFEFCAGQTRPLEKLQMILNQKKMHLDSRFRGNDKGLPRGIFTGGWVGWFSYDLGRYIEPSAFTTSQIAEDDLSLPLIRLCFYDRLIAFDHSKSEFWLLALRLENDAEEPDEKIAGLEDLLKKAQNVTVTPQAGRVDYIEFSKLRCNMSREYYLSSFDRIKRHIYDGDVYQINFSQRFECEYKVRPIDLFHWQNRYNPSPYSAYIDAGPYQIVSTSPEMFITINNRTISTKPIKGTRRRIEDLSPSASRTNTENYQQLLASEKEKAELNMIIDLERNDIARICIPGTRKVIQPRTIETYSTVFHTVATVEGTLRDDVDFCDILKAVFPGGSITGAPKIRAMQIINETEPTTRGIYTGSIGYIGIDGSVCLNIAIRTIIITSKTAYVQTGGGIVADSEPQAEWNETLVKARALIAGIQAVQSRKNL